MSLNILIDEDSLAKILIILLKKAGHDVITVNDSGLSGESDEIVLSYAISEKRLLLTRNYDDFLKLHRKTSTHSGILVICQDDNSAKDMSYKSIVKAIANLEAASIPLTNQFISLNHWNY